MLCNPCKSFRVFDLLKLNGPHEAIGCYWILLYPVLEGFPFRLSLLFLALRFRLRFTLAKRDDPFFDLVH